MNTAAIVPDPPAMSTSFIQGIDNTTVLIGAFGFLSLVMLLRR